LRPNFQYMVQHEIVSPTGDTFGPPLQISTGDLPIQVPRIVRLGGETRSGILLQSVLNATSIATDLSGNVVWYAPDMLSFLTRATGQGTFLGLIEDGT